MEYKFNIGDKIEYLGEHYNGVITAFQTSWTSRNGQVFNYTVPRYMIRLSNGQEFGTTEDFIKTATMSDTEMDKYRSELIAGRKSDADDIQGMFEEYLSQPTSDDIGTKITADQILAKSDDDITDDEWKLLMREGYATTYIVESPWDDMGQDSIGYKRTNKRPTQELFTHESEEDLAKRGL